MGQKRRLAMNANMNNMHVNVDDAEAPPPPYTETDIYSNSGGPRSAASSTSHTGLTPLDDASSTGEVVYTPPLTPRTSSNTHLEPRQSAEQPGATVYFDSRPPPTNPPTETLVHTVRVESTSLPDDLPYQNDWAARDVTPQDWATFVNFLLPDHTTRGNEAVIERKLRSEWRGGDALTSGRSQAEAQLEQMRENGAATTRSRSEIEATVQQWNDGFFGPRGMSVRLDPEARMPGAWAAEPEAPEQQRENNSSIFGKLSIGSDGIRYGDTVVLDSNGIKINGLIVNNEGISMGNNNQPLGTAAPQQRSFAGPSGPTGPAGPAGPSWAFGGRPGWDHHRHDFRDFRHGGHDWHHDRHHDRHHGRHHWHDRREGQHSEDRGRRWYPDRKDGHDRSHSVSSTSSDSSSSSESSIGSLPDYDDIKDHQLPLYAERLQDWTSHPDQVRTKSDIRALKAELKAVPKGPADPNFNRRALKGQIKGLQASWKSIKRAQRQTRKAYRRERRMQRRAEKREHRNQRREMRRAHKDYRRHGGPFHVQPPPIPPVPSAPPAPPAPPGPTAGPNPPPWTPNWPRGCTGPSQRSSFFFGPDGPLGERGPFGHRGAFGGHREGGPFGRGGWGNWGSWGRGGRGCGVNGAGGPWGPAVGGNPREAPGAWPEDGHESGTSSHVAPPGAVAAAKYKAAEQIEAEIAKLAAKAAGAEEGRGAVEKEMEALTDKLEAVRMEADEAYARELAE